MKNRKRITIFYSRLIGVGGAERVALEETKHFSRKYDARLLTFSLKPEALFEYKDLKIVNLNFIDDNQYFDFAQTLKRTLALARELKRSKTDLVIAVSTAGIYELFFATLIYPIAYILHIHGTIFWFEKDDLKYALVFRRAFNTVKQSVLGHIEFIPPKNYGSFPKRLQTELMAMLNYLAVKRAKKVLVLSDHMKWEVRKLYQKNSTVAPAVLIPPHLLNYTPKEDIRKKMQIDEGTQIILSICRLDPRKRINVLIKAFARICDEIDATLIIGGQGPEEFKLKDLTKKLGIFDRVKFVGFIPENELWDYYAACDIFTYPGWGDFAITIYEALALGKKVVCSSEIEIPQSAFVFKVDPNVEDFALGLKKAMEARVETKQDIQELVKFDYFKKMDKIIDKLLVRGR